MNCLPNKKGLLIILATLIAVGGFVGIIWFLYLLGVVYGIH